MSKARRLNIVIEEIEDTIDSLKTDRRMNTSSKKSKQYSENVEDGLKGLLEDLLYEK